MAGADITQIIIAIVSSGIVTAIITNWFTRRVPPAQAQEYLGKAAEAKANAERVLAEAEVLRQQVETADWNRALASIKELKTENENLRQQHKQLQTEYGQLRYEHDELKRLYQDLERTLKRRDGRIEELQRTEVAQSEEIAELRALVRELSEENEHLRARVEQLEVENRRLKANRG